MYKDFNETEINHNFYEVEAHPLCEKNYNNFDFYSMLFPPEEFPEMHQEKQKIKIKKKIIIKKKIYVSKTNLNKLKRTELMALCKKKGIKRYSKKKKADLILMLKQN